MIASLLPVLRDVSPQVPPSAPPQHLSVSASFKAPAKPGGLGAVLVTFVPKDPEVHVNEEPAPRLKLDPGQNLLVDKQTPPASRIEPFDPDNARYLDTTFPASFPVAWAEIGRAHV